METDRGDTGGRVWAGGSKQEIERGLLVGGAVFLLIVAIDVALAPGVILVTGYTLAPMIASAFAVMATVALSGLMVVVALSSFLWHHNFGQSGYWLRVVFDLVAAAVAVMIAIRRVNAETVSARLRLLDDIGSIADGS